MSKRDGLLWGIWFEDHWHVDYHYQISVFVTRKHARDWLKKYAMPGCSVRALSIISQ